MSSPVRTNTLYYVRHGENRANQTHEFSYIKVDYPLNELGVVQAQQTARHLQDQGISAVYASPLRRAAQTAEIIGQTLGLSVTIVEPFREINVGTLEDEPTSEENWALHDRIFADWLAGRSEAIFPGGEDHHSLVHRMSAGLREATRGRSGERIVVAAHGGMLAATVNVLCDNFHITDFATLRSTARVPNCSITEFEIDSSDDPAQMPRLTLTRWASCTHLT